MTQSVLITGGAGFIGCSLAARLLDAGHPVTVLDVLHPQVHSKPGRPERLPRGAELVIADVSEARSWSKLERVVCPEIVIHLAAETGTGQSLTEASRHGNVNVVGTTEMLDAFSRADHVPAHFVLASSRAVYGDGRWLTDDGEMFYAAPRRHEDLVAGRWNPRSPTGGQVRPVASIAGVTEPRPTNIYAATKLAQEHILGAWVAARGSRLSILRLQNVYGRGQSLTNSYTGVLTLFARLAASRTAIEVFEDGDITRDFVHVDDVADVLAAAAKTPPSESRVVDIGSGRPTTILDVARLIAKLTGSPEPQVSGRFRDGDVRAASCTNDAARAQLRYEPSRGLQEGLEDLLAWVKTENG